MARIPTIGKTLDKILALRSEAHAAAQKAAQACRERSRDREEALLRLLTPEEGALAREMLKSLGGSPERMLHDWERGPNGAVVLGTSACKCCDELASEENLLVLCSGVSPLDPVAAIPEGKK